jgi:hypothetical protein
MSENSIALKEDHSDEHVNLEAPIKKASTIHVKFKGNSDQIVIQSKATGETNKVAAANRKLRLISGRLYFIPVDQIVNSDEYGNIKQYSETSDKFEVLYVKDGYACIDPILHNALIVENQRLCIIW